MLIGITGPAGSGKDTAGEWIVSYFDFERYAIANPLKAALAAMGLPEPSNRDLKESPVPGFNFSWRRAAQTLGTEWGRGLDEDLWLKLAERHITQRMTAGKSVVVTDVRFENEAAMVRRLGGYVLHMTGRKAPLDGLESHQSEAGVKVARWDVVIDNSGSLTDLTDQLEGFMYG